MRVYERGRDGRGRGRARIYPSCEYHSYPLVTPAVHSTPTTVSLLSSRNLVPTLALIVTDTLLAILTACHADSACHTDSAFHTDSACHTDCLPRSFFSLVLPSPSLSLVSSRIILPSHTSL